MRVTFTHWTCPSLASEHVSAGGRSEFVISTVAGVKPEYEFVVRVVVGGAGGGVEVEGVDAYWGGKE